ncbi:hypothetical protein HF521_016858 [Silurus meridionalis]|uniref:Uncharacterized protein n=1 Tax=Silurus meridionalis TaxID=175797 RepID=A0A8T0BKK3_SILME|nr:hypothetical protein HF521_016858 [Silurus meridionalis]
MPLTAPRSPQRLLQHHAQHPAPPPRLAPWRSLKPRFSVMMTSQSWSVPCVSVSSTTSSTHPKCCNVATPSAWSASRINIKSSQPDSLQCPLCRAYTPVPTLGLPKLATDIVVLSCLPEAMQRVYSIHFNHNRGKLQLKGIPSSVPPSPNRQHRSLDLGEQVNTELEQDPPSSVCSRFILIMMVAFFIITQEDGDRTRHQFSQAARPCEDSVSSSSSSCEDSVSPSSSSCEDSVSSKQLVSYQS